MNRTTTARERRQIDEVRLLLESLGYPTAAHAINDALVYDSQRREDEDTARADSEADHNRQGHPANW
jgi:hypothetical protein